MSNDKLDAFLKKNAPRAPAPPLGEKARIWRAIEDAQSHDRIHWRDWLSLPQLRFALPALAALVVALPALAALVVVLTGLHAKKVRHDAEVDRVLMSALSYQLEDSGDDSPF